MVLLAIDLSGEAAQVALSAQGREIVTRVFKNDRQVAAALPQSMNELLDEANAMWSDVEGIIYVRGPGRFSGLRLAAGFAHATAHSKSIVVKSASALLCLAIQGREAHPNAKRIAARLSAGQDGSWYVGVFQYAGGQWQVILEPEHMADHPDMEDIDLWVGSVGELMQPSFVCVSDVSTLLRHFDHFDPCRSIYDIKLDYLKKNLYKPN